jgi:hypothetical protein
MGVLSSNFHKSSLTFSLQNSKLFYEVPVPVGKAFNIYNEGMFKIKFFVLLLTKQLSLLHRTEGTEKTKFFWRLIGSKKTLTASLKGKKYTQ